MTRASVNECCATASHDATLRAGVAGGALWDIPGLFWLPGAGEAEDARWASHSTGFTINISLWFSVSCLWCGALTCGWCEGWVKVLYARVGKDIDNWKCAKVVKCSHRYDLSATEYSSEERPLKIKSRQRVLVIVKITTDFSWGYFTPIYLNSAHFALHQWPPPMIMSNYFMKLPRISVITAGKVTRLCVISCLAFFMMYE